MNQSTKWLTFGVRYAHNVSTTLNRCGVGKDQAPVASIFEIVDRALDGGLADRLRELRADGKSIDQITEIFAADGYHVSRETIRRWMKHGDIPTHRVPAS